MRRRAAPPAGGAAARALACAARIWAPVLCRAQPQDAPPVREAAARARCSTQTAGCAPAGHARARALLHRQAYSQTHAVADAPVGGESSMHKPKRTKTSANAAAARGADVSHHFFAATDEANTPRKGATRARMQKTTAQVPAARLCPRCLGGHATVNHYTHVHTTPLCVCLQDAQVSEGETRIASKRASASKQGEPEAGDANVSTGESSSGCLCGWAGVGLG